MAKTAVSRFATIIRLIRFCVKICGTDVSNPNYRMWAWTYLITVTIFAYFGFTGYTVYRAVQERDFTTILLAIATVGSGAQGLVKLVCCVGNATLVRNIQLTYESMYREYEDRSRVYSKYLHQRINNFYYLVLGFVFLYTTTVIIMICFPLFELVVYNKKAMILHFLIPGIDHKSDTGYVIMFGIHSTFLFLGAFGNFGGDMYLFLFIINIPLLKDIFKEKFNELNELVVQPDKYKEMHAKLWDLLDWHQKYATILRGTKKIYTAVMFVELISTCFGILCTISCIFMKNWPTAPFYLLYCFIVLYTFCGLGTIVETTNEQFTNEIYSNCLWYELPVREQKLVILMLAKSQDERSLTAADMLPLSMTTALQLTKAIYSFSMMMITYLDYEI